MTRATTPPAASDQGFTLVELLTAMAVFGVLMVFVASAMLTGFSAIRDIMQRTESQAQAQNSAEWAARLLRYAAVPEGQTAVITEATTNSITFYTYSGTGSKHDVPYKARLYVTTNANGTKTLNSQVWTPTPVSGGYTWTTTPFTRSLLTVDKEAGKPLTVSVRVCNPTTSCATTRRTVPLLATGVFTLATGEVPQDVLISIGDPLEPRSVVTQQVRLVNLA